MYNPSAFIFTAIVALASIAVATPPSCFIAALGAQPDPSDMKALCGTLQPQLAGNITEICSGSAKSSAIAVYSSSCLASESVTISTIASTTTKGSSTKASTHATATGTATETGTVAASTSGATAGAGSAAQETATQSGASATESVASPTGTSAASLSSSQSGLMLAPIALVVGLVGQYFV